MAINSQCRGTTLCLAAPVNQLARLYNPGLAHVRPVRAVDLIAFMVTAFRRLVDYQSFDVFAGDNGCRRFNTGFQFQFFDTIQSTSSTLQLTSFRTGGKPFDADFKAQKFHHN